MSSQKGFGVVLIILTVFGVLVLGTVGTAALALLGKAPACPTTTGSARTGDAIGKALESGSVTITDGEATEIAKGFVGDKISDPRVCFTKGLGHISGKINLGKINPSFYVSGGVDLSGNTPKATNLKIQLGSLPNNPILSSLAQNALNRLIDENLEKIELKEKYSAEFSTGSLTIKK